MENQFNVALSNLYYVFFKHLDFIFNQMQIDTNITVGWILLSIFIFVILITNLLNVPYINNERFNYYLNQGEHGANVKTRYRDEYGRLHERKEYMRKDYK